MSGQKHTLSHTERLTVYVRFTESLMDSMMVWVIIQSIDIETQNVEAVASSRDMADEMVDALKKRYPHNDYYINPPLAVDTIEIP